ncbi:MAG TPA: NB-ARC domain-containing protein, partial [Gaiellaceae bacterium]|nr:NB-ARC domain-containing protein [Gaiellaceae bacterium]
EALAAGPISVRVGVHTGTPLLTDEGYVGDDVHRAARVAAAGHGGQVLVSASTALLVEIELTDLGRHRFKDLAAPEQVFQLGAAAFPPLSSLFRTNLPIPANPLIGRKKELVDVLRLLLTGSARAVTVTGPGGIGKTRFAIAAAAEASDDFPDGVWFVDLTPVRDPALVPSTIAHAAGAEGDLARALRDSRCLLVLDNFEQVVAAARDVAEVLAACPSVRVLATSREPLRIAAEQEYELRPLPEAPAVELFRHRVAAAMPETEVAYSIASEICRRLDGLPLAIELGAARVKVLEPQALLERLDDRLPILVTRARDVPERQRGLHATIEWSYDLLDPDEQQLFRRLAAFRGGSTLDAIEGVAGASADLIESLVDKSLLRRRGGRFVMLETIREFARDELAASGEDAQVREAHARFYAGVAEAANLNAGDLRPGGQRLDLAIAEQDNIRSALSWAIGAGEFELAARIASAMEQFWVVNDPTEGMRWFATLLEHEERIHDRVLLGHTLRSYGSATDIAGDDGGAHELYERSLALFDELGDERGRAVLLHRLAIQAMRRGDPLRARELVEASHAIHERHGDRWGLAQTVGTLGALERDAGNGQRAYELIDQSAVLAMQVDVLWWHAGMLMELAALSLEAGRTSDAESTARQSLELAQRMRDYGGRVFGVGLLACVAADRAEPGLAGRLWGAIEGDLVGAPLGGWLRHRAACEAHVARVTGRDFEQGLAIGRHLSLDEAVALALEEREPDA